jgi:curved DNA-binding protein CbpA
VTGRRDAYKVLQVDPEADEVVVRAAYRALARKLHPDSSGHRLAPDPRMAELNAAYALIRDPTARAEYDRSRGSGGSRRTATAVPPPPASGDAAGSATRLDFGRYEGWSLRDIARHDLDYLRWLQRHASGARFRTQIDELLRSKR